MALESASFIDGLVITNPPGTDDKRQGDDHIRLIKNVLKNTFPNASKPFSFPENLSLTGTSYTLAEGDVGKTIRVNTSGGAFTLTLPSIPAASSGWRVRVWKTTADVSPIFIVGTGLYSGAAANMTKLRRALPFVPFDIEWTGDVWLIQRCVQAPIGSVIPLFTGALPAGYEWPNGQTLATANYPEYALLRGSGSTPDLRQRTVFGTNLGGADTGRITSVIGPTLDNAGGHQFMQSHNHGGATGAQNANHQHGYSWGGTTSDDSPDHTHNYGSGPISGGSGGGSLIAFGAQSPTGGANSRHTHSYSGSSTTGSENASHQHAIPSEGSGNQQNMPPAIICNYALVVE